MKRRDFIKQTASAAAASLVISGGILICGNRNNDAQKVSKKFLLKNYRVKSKPDWPILSIAHGQDYRRVVASALAIFGGIEPFISKGEKVCLKPNIGWDRTPELAANTNPEVVAELVRLCLKAGAAKVTVVDVSCNDPKRTFNRSGIKAAAEAEGAEVIIPNRNHYAMTDFGDDSLGRWKVLKPVIECDKLINMPVVKHHSLSGITSGMKNWFGVITGPRNRLHQDIHYSIAELGRLFQPTLTIEDATRVLVRNGPTGGRINDVKVCDSIVISPDQVAADAYVARFLNKTPTDFPYIAIAEQKGLGVINPPENKIASVEV
ncbi:MAG: DUF362 domain-containing protein [candidate division Zixibacteria bacterium]|nr:DUF362 domain-containing protein [candidate division Zixibacteria bacterium]